MPVLLEEEGGCVYPVITDGDPCLTVYSEGLSLRDYFANNAPEMDFQYWEDYQNENPTGHITNAISEWNYRYADAMIREKKKNG